jgi:hypothetical protein
MFAAAPVGDIPPASVVASRELGFEEAVGIAS